MRAFGAVQDFAAVHDSVPAVVVVPTPEHVATMPEHIAVIAAVAPEDIAEPRVVRPHAAMVAARPAAVATASPTEVATVVVSHAQYTRATPLRRRLHACAEDEHEQDNERTYCPQQCTNFRSHPYISSESN
jgi:hypothetical protein